MHSDQFFTKRKCSRCGRNLQHTPDSAPRPEPCPVRAGPSLCADVTPRSESRERDTQRRVLTPSSVAKRTTWAGGARSRAPPPRAPSAAGWQAASLAAEARIPGTRRRPPARPPERRTAFPWCHLQCRCLCNSLTVIHLFLVLIFAV